MVALADNRVVAAVVAAARTLARAIRLSRWWFNAIWLVFLANSAGEVADKPWSPVLRGLLIAGIAVFAVCYIWCTALWNDAEEHPVLRYAVPLVMYLLAAPISMTGPHSGGYVYIYVAAGAALALPPRWIGWAFAAVGVSLVATGLYSGASLGDVVLALVITLFVGLMVMVFRGRERARAELREARETLARLAVNEERLRLARDLHDLLGHSLSLITLKSELAGRFLPANPEAAAREVADIEQVSRQALVDVREAVSGYRRPTLDVELARADQALTTARVEFLNEVPEGRRAGWLAPAREAALAWALREAVTNVVRHSQARRCWVRLVQRDAELMLEVADDGHGAAASNGEDAGAPVPYGNGLSGLYERLALESGRLETAADGTGFMLRAFVPVGQGEETGGRTEVRAVDPASG
jgi:two-component system sensor histidine kinase DesK